MRAPEFESQKAQGNGENPSSNSLCRYLRGDSYKQETDHEGNSIHSSSVSIIDELIVPTL